jgi:DNA invertase Pin-like site-specific DNA recombinase
MHDDATDLKTLKYVLYLRKSTEDEGRQIRSIKDQERDCREMAVRLGLNIVDVLHDKKSAKQPGKRRGFTDLLRRIRAKEFDAIIS